MDYAASIQLIQNLKKQFGGSKIFGVEKDKSFKSSIAAIYQSAGGKDAYPSVEEKAAHLLYFVTKNHSFVDGNKRIGALLFLLFLYENLTLEGLLKNFSNTTLTALCYLVAISPSDQKEQLINLITHFISAKEFVFSI